ncbi:hypothetical protein VULLAG_LOCUS11987 [Vulpes lagopus]
MPRGPPRCLLAAALLQERRHLRAGQLLRVPRPLHRPLLRARPEAQRLRRTDARSLDGPRLPPLQVCLRSPALPPPPDPGQLRTWKIFLLHALMD